MTVYKYFMKTVYRNKNFLLGYSIIFFFMSFLNSSAGQRKEDFTSSSYNIGIVDESKSQIASELLAYLDKNHKLTYMENKDIEIQEDLYLDRFIGVIKLGEDFDKTYEEGGSPVELIGNRTSYKYSLLENEINKYLNFLYLSEDGGIYDFERVGSSLLKGVEVEIVENYDDIDNGFKVYFNFVSYVIVAIYVALIGFTMSDFNEEEIKLRTYISSKELSKFNMEMYLGQMSTGLLITSIFILGVFWVFGSYSLEVNLFKYIANLLVFSFSILCFTFLINNITKDKNILNMISVVFSLGMSFISGVMVPQYVLPSLALNISKLFPMYYYVRGVNKPGSIGNILGDIGIQVLFGVFFLVLGVFISREKRKV